MLPRHTAIGLLTMTAIAAAAPAPVAPKPAVEFFPLSDVRLLDGPFKQNMQADRGYLLSLDPDRLLAGFRQNAGLPEKAKKYGGWENRGLAGQTAGHYLSALALMVASTGDEDCRKKLEYTVNELAECQAAAADGFLAGMPDGHAIFDKIEKADLGNKGGFDLNGTWVPWYNQHKLFAGLRDAWLLARNETAKAAYIKLGDWCEKVTANLDDAKMQQMLAVEQGGMMETLADLYAVTGDAKYLTLAKKFWHKAVLDPLAAGQDKLTGLHANTNIPKVIGAARLYELTGDAKYKKAADTFWDVVVHQRSFVTGSNSDREHFFKTGVEAGKLGVQNGETCNVYNMLKLTGHLVSWGEQADKFDFYERALFNHILGSINPDSGTCTYFQPLEAGRFKVYGSHDESFWCCVGTGLENHAKYAEFVYSRTADSQGDTLRVNLFMASELNWADKGLTLRQETTFPYNDTTKLTVNVKQPTKLKLQVRVPGWADKGVTVSGVAGVTSRPGDAFITIDRIWNDGDAITVKMPMSLKAHKAIDDPSTVALLYGPVVLAGRLGTTDMPSSQVQADHTSQDRRPVPDVPVLVTNDASLAWVKPVDGEPLHFKTSGVGKPGDVTLVPFADVRHERYAVYFKMLTPTQFAEREKQMEQQRAAARDLATRTSDEVVFGEQQSEKDHDVASERSDVGGFNGRTWRDARDGGFFSAKLKAKPGAKQVVRCTYWGSDSGNRTFDVLADGKVIGTQKLTAQHPNAFFDVDYPLPATTAETVEIKFQAKPGQAAGGVFGCRIVTAKE